MISRLVLRGFKVFEDQEFNFEKGTTAVVGPNGSGKTSILEAIEFALFRQVSRKEKTIKKLEDLISHNQEHASIELEFIAPINRRKYRVVRSIHTKRSTADLFQDDESEPYVSGANNVTEEIVKLLGMDRHAFSAVVYVRQGEIDNLSRMEPKERRLDLYNMMGLGIYEKTGKEVKKRIRAIKKEIGGKEESRRRLSDVRDHLPSKEEIDAALNVIMLIEEKITDEVDISSLKAILDRVVVSIDEVENQLTSHELTDSLGELEEETELAKRLRTILDAIPDIAEEQIRPHIREEARAIFRGIFGDKYSDLQISDNYEVALFNLQGVRVPLVAASGGEDVCVNFALRVAVNTALQKYSIAGPPPGLLILDEPGAGLDAQRRRWLPEAVGSLESVNQVIVVTHMEELREAADHVIMLIPQGKGRQPLVEIQD